MHDKRLMKYSLITGIILVLFLSPMMNTSYSQTIKDVPQIFEKANEFCETNIISNGLLLYNEKIEQLIKEKKQLTYKIEKFEKKNSLLTDNIDLDYLETLYREKFMVGKKSEKIFVK